MNELVRNKAEMWHYAHCAAASAKHKQEPYTDPGYTCGFVWALSSSQRLLHAAQDANEPFDSLRVLMHAKFS